MATGLSKKRDCDDGQPCGNSCIAKGDNCTAFVAKSAATGLLKSVRSAVDEAAKDKVGTAAAAAGTALSFAFPLELAYDGDVVVSVVSSSLAFMAHKVISQVQKRKASL